MLYCVEMDVRVPHDVDGQHFAQLKAAEKGRAQELLRFLARQAPGLPG